jgi:hypothetical protein
MAKLNFALQNVAISRSELKSKEKEDKLRSGANCMHAAIWLISGGWDQRIRI